MNNEQVRDYNPAGGSILDIGGGPGRYTIRLAKRGYRVVLADLSPDLVNIGRAKIAAADVQAHVDDILTAHDPSILGAGIYLLYIRTKGAKL